MEAVRNEFAEDLRFAHCEFQQPGDAKRPAPPCARHTIEGVGDLAHSVGEGGRRVFVPGIAVAAARTDPVGLEGLNELERPG